MARFLTVTKATLAAAVISAVGVMWLGSVACPQDDLVCVFTWRPR
jgi:hypothetical protein